MPATKTAAQADAEAQLRGFIGKFAPKDRTRIRATRKALRLRFPTATELVWDNYNFFVIAYSPTERPSDAIFSLACKANGMSLCFMHGARLPDPDGVLQGSGTQTRFVRLESAAALQKPEVETVLAAAVADAKVALPTSGHGKLIIRGVSVKQRPRKSPSK